MKRLFVNAFCPQEHKVVSSEVAYADFPDASESLPLPLPDPRPPSVISKRQEPALGHKRIDLRTQRRCFRGTKVIVDHEPTAVIQQVTIAIQITAHIIVSIEYKQADLAAAQA